jgi:polyisoprenoid-binding protein YceI
MRFALVVFVISIFFAACEDPSANKPRAQTSEPVSGPANRTSANTSDSTALPISPENSRIEFVGSKVTGSHEGGFKRFSGSIDLVGDKPADSRVSIEIEMTSVFADVDQLTQHLKSPDFFDVQKFPKATFISTKITPDASVPEQYNVTGDFDLHGVRKSITFPATIKVTPENITVKAEFSINRKDFGIMYAGKSDDLIRDGVVIKLDLKAPRKE